MVMETPSPQCVGREFVRQYYTLLNEAPHFLHRFYSHNSSFLHGGNEKHQEQLVVIGQSEIHKKIMSLNLKDCHAKIRYVDSQATIGTGVVVQVTGELSNAGEPMRRFMQTFVLAPQTANKYYVHNDIFRYQDEVFDETDEEIESEDQNLNQLSKNVQDSMVITKQPDNLSNQINSHPSAKQPAAQQQSHGITGETKLSNGQHHHMQSNSEPKASQSAPQQFAKTAAAVELSKTNSWAHAVEKNDSGDFPSEGAASPPADISQNNVPEVTSLHFKSSQTASKEDSSAANFNRQKPEESKIVEDRRPERKTYPDNQQVFVGNLPIAINESELKDVFKSYGAILDVRIHKKYQSDSRTTYGFIVFNDVEVTQKVLALKSIDYKSVKLNIEEKRPRSEGKPMGMQPRRHRDGNRPYRSGRGGYMGGPNNESGGRSEQRRYLNTKPSL